MIQLFMALKGKHYARLLAFLSFLSFLALIWLVLLSDRLISNSEVIWGAAAFILMGVGSGSIASADGEKKP